MGAGRARARRHPCARQGSHRGGGSMGAPWAVAGGGADTYVFEKDHTGVRFTWDHLGLSRQGGRFLDVEGAVTFDPNRPEDSTVDVKIPLKSIATGIPKLDEHLVRSKEFFDVEQFPVITFKTTSVRRTDTKIAE